jgi:cell division protease FtsH
MFIPEQDRWSQSRQYLNSNIASLFGGRIAEEIIYGKELVSTGASNDIERATGIARKMVTKWGMSDRLGPILYAEEEGEVFLGRSVTKNKHVSDDTAKIIDEEVQNIMFTNYELAKRILNENLDILHAMKDALLKYETIDSAQLDDLMARREVREPQQERGEAKEPMDDKQFDKVKDAGRDDVTVVDVNSGSSSSDNSQNKTGDSASSHRSSTVETDSWDDVDDSESGRKDGSNEQDKSDDQSNK